MKIGILTHTDGLVDPRILFNHIHAIACWSKQYEICYIGIEGEKVARARNKLIEKAKEAKCNYVFFLDGDHMVEDSTLPYLMSNKDCAMVSGLVIKRGEPHPQVGFVLKEDQYCAVNLPIDGKSYGVDICAFGCTLIDMKVFEKMEMPYFRDETALSRQTKNKWNKRSDVIFCENVRKQGGIVRIDTRAQIGHIGHAPIHYPKDFELSHEFQLEVYKKASEIYKQNNLTSVLDIGCRTGLKVSHFFDAKTANIHGIDVDPEVITYCKEAYNDSTWHLEDIENTDLFLGDFDLVMCADIVEHLNDPVKLFSFIKKHSRKDTYIIISTPEKNSIGDDIQQNADHKHCWTQNEFKNLLIENGFDIIESVLLDEVINYKCHLCICKVQDENWAYDHIRSL